MRNLNRTLCAAAVVATVTALTACSSPAESAGPTVTSSPSASAAVTSAISSTPLSVGQLVISPASEREERLVPNERVTGTVRATTLVTPNDTTTNRMTDVTFEPGARSAWHSHPAGEHLVVTGGSGWLQQDGQSRINLEVGDVVWIPADIRHWQGATPDQALESIELQGVVDDVNTEWAELVTDELYQNG